MIFFVQFTPLFVQLTPAAKKPSETHYNNINYVFCVTFKMAKRKESMMKKRFVCILTTVMMLLTMFGYGSAIAVRAVEVQANTTDKHATCTEISDEIVAEEDVNEVQPMKMEETTPSTAGTTIDIGYSNINITSVFRDGLDLDKWGASSSRYSYTGSLIRPKVDLVTYDDNWEEIKLIEGTDYNIKYPDNAVNPGKYNIVFTGIGKYTGTRNVQFTIQKVEVPAVAGLKVSTAKKSPYIKFNAVKLDGATIKYKVLYRKGSSVTWTTVTSGTTKTKLTVKGLASQKKYTVAVIPIATVDGKSYEGAATIKNVKGYTPSGTAINTGDEFIQKIKANPSGKYYLVNSITLPANTQIDTFKGTLDGNGFTIKNYVYSASKYCQAGLFKSASNATFKNIKMTGVNISVSSISGAYVGALVMNASNCTFSNVKTYGKITINGTGSYVGGQNFTIGGISAISSGSTKYSKCLNDIDISVSSRTPYTGVVVGGITSGNYSGSISSCTNTGNITAVGAVNDYSNSFRIAGLVGDSVKTASSCKNNGKIALMLESEHNSSASMQDGAAGICGKVVNTITSCKNTGAVTVNNKADVYNVYAAGILGSLTASKGYMSKCNNKGAITFSGKAGSHYYGAKVAGLAAECAKATQCFNKGTVKATVSSGFGKVGGVCSVVYAINNSYNAATVSLKGDGYVGGLAADANIDTSKGAYYNYNSGKVTASGLSKTKKFYGAIFGSHTGIYGKYTANYNYYKSGTSSRAYGHVTVTNKYKAKATKVSSLKKSKCKKLSSKYWKYNKKVKRMVLKYNAE